jgi:hypothetical protein
MFRLLPGSGFDDAQPKYGRGSVTVIYSPPLEEGRR